MRYLLTLALLLLAAPVVAQEAPPHGEGSAVASSAPEACEGTCVPDEDLQQLVELLKERACLDTTQPEFDLDSVKVVIDKDGRVFFSGAAPHPYTLRMKWCHYEIEAEGKVDVVAAMMKPSIWGFRFRPKAYITTLPLEPLYPGSIQVADAVDAGVMVDFLHYDWLNLNAAVGFRSFGLGLGADLTSNFGAYVGYANTWGDWHHNVGLGLWFSFYNPD